MDYTKYYGNLNNAKPKSFKEFINFCLEYLPNIKKYPLPKINQNKNKIKLNVVFIEFREKPHCEFIIRNNILKLKDKAYYSIICCESNYEMFKNFNIPNINIIKKPFTTPTRGEYSFMLGQKNFWEELEGEYILICQGDSIIFDSNIEDFYGYDYIGSPWLKPTTQKQMFIGNGGFSLRKKSKMIEICSKFNIVYMPNFMKPLQFMTEKDNNICPEDVYFSQYLLKVPSILPDFDKAVKFSIETFSTENPFGGHNFFKHNWKKYLEKYTISYKEKKEQIKIKNKKNYLIKIPNSNEFYVKINNQVYTNKHLNSDIGKVFIKRSRKKQQLLDRKKELYFEKVFIYQKRFDHNWRHFLLETFFDLKDVYQDKNIKIIISKNSSKHVMEILTILNVNNYHKLDDNTIIYTNEIILPSKNDELKNKFLNNFIEQCNNLAKMINIKSSPKLFLTRNNHNKNYRYVSNQDKLNEILKEKNYYFLQGGTIPLFKQIYLINNAKIIITQIGANCDNVIFCNKNTKFKIIYPYNCKVWAYWYNRFKNTQLLYCGNKYTNNGQKDKYNWNYEIDFTKFEI